MVTSRTSNRPRAQRTVRRLASLRQATSDPGSAQAEFTQPVYATTSRHGSPLKLDQQGPPITAAWRVTQNRVGRPSQNPRSTKVLFQSALPISE